MRLFAQKMNQNVVPLVQFIDFSGYIAQLALGTNLVEKDRHQLGKLF